MEFHNFEEEKTLLNKIDRKQSSINNEGAKGKQYVHRLKYFQFSMVSLIGTSSHAKQSTTRLQYLKSS